MERLFPGHVRSCRGPHRASVRRGLHQPGEDSLAVGQRTYRPGRGSPDPAVSRAYCVHLAADARPEHFADGGRGARGGAGGVRLDRDHPGATPSEVVDDTIRPASTPRAARNACPDLHSTDRNRGHCGVDLRVRWPVLAGGWYGLLDARSDVRRLGTARGDQQVSGVLANSRNITHLWEAPEDARMNRG